HSSCKSHLFNTKINGTLQDEWELEPENLEAIENKGWTVIRTSAKTGLNVEEVFQTLATKILEG
ncbi:MAG: hypothetical protein AAFR37_23080, partial [Cyanobacteria bacterium J06628_3]